MNVDVMNFSVQRRRRQPNPIQPPIFMIFFRRLVLVAAAASLVTVAAAQEARLKLATVDMQELFKQYYKTNEAQQQINVERARIQKENNDRQARIREIENNIGNLRKQLDDPSVADPKKQTLY